MRDKDRR
jgi:hypothetical protein